MRHTDEAILPVEELLHNINRRAVFSTVDLKWGFHQILLNEGSRHITTFVTHRGMCQYKRLMFGMTSAPGKYQQIVRDGTSIFIQQGSISFQKNIFQKTVRLRVL